MVRRRLKGGVLKETRASLVERAHALIESITATTPEGVELIQNDLRGIFRNFFKKFDAAPNDDVKNTYIDELAVTIRTYFKSSFVMKPRSAVRELLGPRMPVERPPPPAPAPAPAPRPAPAPAPAPRPAPRPAPAPPQAPIGPPPPLPDQVPVARPRMRPEGPEHPAPKEGSRRGIKLIDPDPEGKRADIEHIVLESRVPYYLEKYPHMYVAPNQGMGKPRKCRKCGGYKVSPR